MTKQDKILIAIVSILLALLVFMTVKSPLPTKSVGDFNQYPIFSQSNATSTLCGTTSTNLIGTSTSRSFISISNISPNTIFLSFGPNPAVAYTGTALAASSTFTFNSGAVMFSGAITCIATGGNSSTTITEFK